MPDLDELDTEELIFNVVSYYLSNALLVLVSSIVCTRKKARGTGYIP